MCVFAPSPFLGPARLSAAYVARQAGAAKLRPFAWATPGRLDRRAGP
jgi:hypothetical protein